MVLFYLLNWGEIRMPVDGVNVGEGIVSGGNDV